MPGDKWCARAHTEAPTAMGPRTKCRPAPYRCDIQDVAGVPIHVARYVISSPLSRATLYAMSSVPLYCCGSAFVSVVHLSTYRELYATPRRKIHLSPWTRRPPRHSCHRCCALPSVGSVLRRGSTRCRRIFHPVGVFDHVDLGQTVGP